MEFTISCLSPITQETVEKMQIRENRAEERGYSEGNMMGGWMKLMGKES